MTWNNRTLAKRRNNNLQLDQPRWEMFSARSRPQEQQNNLKRTRTRLETWSEIYRRITLFFLSIFSCPIYKQLPREMIPHECPFIPSKNNEEGTRLPQPHSSKVLSSTAQTMGLLSTKVTPKCPHVLLRELYLPSSKEKTHLYDNLLQFLTTFDGTSWYELGYRETRRAHEWRSFTSESLPMFVVYRARFDPTVQRLDGGDGSMARASTPSPSYKSQGCRWSVEH